MLLFEENVGIRRDGVMRVLDPVTECDFRTHACLSGMVSSYVGGDANMKRIFGRITVTLEPY